MVARTFTGHELRNSLPGTACPGSSSLCRRKNATSCASSEDGRVRTCGTSGLRPDCRRRGRRSGLI